MDTTGVTTIAPISGPPRSLLGGIGDLFGKAGQLVTKIWVCPCNRASFLVRANPQPPTRDDERDNVTLLAPDPKELVTPHKKSQKKQSAEESARKKEAKLEKKWSKRPPRWVQISSIIVFYIAAIGNEVLGHFVPDKVIQNLLTNNLLIQSALAGTARASVKGSAATVNRVVRHLITITVGIGSIITALTIKNTFVAKLCLSYGLGPALDQISKEGSLFLKGASEKGRGPKLNATNPLSRISCPSVPVSYQQRLQKMLLIICSIIPMGSSLIPMPLLAKATIVDASTDFLGTYFRIMNRVDRYATLLLGLAVTLPIDFTQGTTFSSLPLAAFIKAVTKTAQFWMRGKKKDEGDKTSYLLTCGKSGPAATEDTPDEDDEDETMSKKAPNFWKQGLITLLTVASAAALNTIPSERQEVKIAQITSLTLAATVAHTFFKNLAQAQLISNTIRYAGLTTLTIAGASFDTFVSPMANLTSLFGALLLKTAPKDVASRFKGNTTTLP